jgi:hypothetical protein
MGELVLSMLLIGVFVLTVAILSDSSIKDLELW